MTEERALEIERIVMDRGVSILKTYCEEDNTFTPFNVGWIIGEMHMKLKQELMKEVEWSQKNDTRRIDKRSID